MLWLIDNYDSFTYNLVHFLGELDVDCHVVRNDKTRVDTVIAAEPQGIVLSPGPCTPHDAGICLELIRAVDGRIPILGVCLGHQAIGEAYGAKVVRASTLMHGKLSPIHHSGNGLFDGLESPITVTRYHSLTLDPATMPECLEVTARADDGTIMGLRHRDLPLHGVQFHPESIACEHGHTMLANFLRLSQIPHGPVPVARHVRPPALQAH